MGLIVTNSCFSGSYGSFHKFRLNLAKQIGIDLLEYIGYGENNTKDLTDVNHDIIPLLNHCDCCGYLTIKDSKEIVKGFNSILENFNEEHSYPGFKERIIMFREGLISAIKERRKVRFI